MAHKTSSWSLKTIVLASKGCFREILQSFAELFNAWEKKCQDSYFAVFDGSKFSRDHTLVKPM